MSFEAGENRLINILQTSSKLSWAMCTHKYIFVKLLRGTVHTVDGSEIPNNHLTQYGTLQIMIMG